jgi:ABC-type dipeptide/oligopeptide/nickel transport system permease component
MAGFILRRLLWTIPILWVVLTIVFFMMRSIGRDPRISKYFVASVVARDYTVVMGVAIVLAVMIICLNLLVDIAHHLLDPRLREA